MKLHLVSLGCARNSVDSEIMLGRLAMSGWTVEDRPDAAEVIIVNTCSFIESAVNESIDTILELAEFKKKGACKNLIVAGCLPERFREKIIQTLPEVDCFIGTGAFNDIVKAVERSADISKCYLPNPASARFQSDEATVRNVSSHYSYLKIAEGCNRQCTYCIIPKLRGKQRSRPLKDIVNETKFLIASGVKELILVAQDTTSYGDGLSTDHTLCNLLEEMAQLSNDIWIRVLYGHPESMDASVIKTMGSHTNICSYFDIPIQHVSTSILKRMGRQYQKDDLYRLFETIRSEVIDASLRTTLITGFPGETDKDFIELLNFIEDMRFEHLGVFMYSDFDDLPSHRLTDHVPDDIAKERHHALMSKQMEISLKNNRKLIGEETDVIVDEKIEENVFQGRTRYQSPDVDGVVYMHTKGLRIGSFTSIRIIDALEYDLIGDAV